ncbi:MAG: long-chain fatty acid--CoA ligase [Betaproteobacteria bacterium]|nr:MAG: long-chain fatty acid--CoA ligase [Betaproteobacteria bacterium]
MRRAFAEDQEQVDKLLACRDRGARPAVLWFDRPRGLRHYRDAGLESLGTLIDAGRRRDHRDPGFFDARLAQGQADDAAARFVERNADGDLRLVTLSHRQLLQRAQTAARAAALRHRDEVLACLSPASLAHSAAGAAQWLVCGYVLSCPESPETVPTDLREIGPTYYAASPHLLQAQFAELQERMHEAGALRRRLFERFPGRTPPALGGLRGAAWRLLIGAPLRNAIGLSRVRAAHLLGDSLHGDVQAFYRALRLEFTPLTDVPQGGGAA